MASRGGSGGGEPNSPSARVVFGEEGEAGGKVKLLCSFGGRIAPRAGDGALRYVGGQMRLISVPRATAFGELMRKVAAVGVGDGEAAADISGGGGVLVKYQLPGEDLDSLISVSCPEDYENMMEEYEKLAAASPDGSAKLRVFLFPASGSEAAVSVSGSHLAATDDAGQRYIDAVNCISVDAAAAIRRKESVASAGSSVHNSEFSEYGGVVEGMSPQAVVPPAVPPEYVYAGGKHYTGAFPESLGFNTVAVSAPAMGVPAQNPILVRTQPPQHPHVSSYVPPPQQPPQVASYASPPQHPPQVGSYVPPPQPYIDPQQVQYINSQQLGMHVVPQSVNFVPMQMSQYMPGVSVTNPMSASAAQVGTLKPIPARTEPVLDDAHFTRPVQTPADLNYRIMQPLSQLPPLPPVHLQTSEAQKYGVQPVVTSTVSMPVVTSSGTIPVALSSASVPVVRYDDCGMCQKALPHTHSDNMIQDQGNSSPASNPEAAPTFYSLHHENVAKQYSPSASVGTPPNYIAEPRVESTVGVAQFEQKIPGRKPIVQAMPTSDPGVSVQPAFGSLPVSSAPVSNGVFVGHPPQSHIEDPFRYQQQQHSHNVQPSQVPVNGIASNPQGMDTGAFKNVNYPVAESARNHAQDLSHDYVRAIDCRMQGVHLGPIAPPESDVQRKPVVSHLGAIGDGKIEKPPVHMDSGAIYRSQAGGHPMGIANAFVTPALIPEENLVRHSEQSPSTSDVGMQNVHSNISQQPSMLHNLLPVSNNLGGLVEQPVSNERFPLKPAYSGVQVPAGSPQLHSGEMLNHLVSATLSDNSPFPSQSTAGVGRVEAAKEPVYSESLFSNQDPWKAVENASLVPPRPIKVAKEPIVTRDPYMEGHSPTINSANAVALLEEGNLPHRQDILYRDIHPAPAQISKGLGEESIKRQLQAVAEGVAASVLQSSFSDKSAGLSEDNVHSGRAVVDLKIEDMRNNQLEKANQGVQVVDDIENLQIIKNSDLEELRELGSGTFGTVYHGKWRGSDVAIKRINDRCFAGKASEQERMRTDFWNEACKLASLHHPNVVAFYGVVLDGPGGSVATVTEYMANGSLRQALQRHEKIFDRRRRLLIAMDVAFGMEYLHGKNIVHFDLKSDNLLVNLRDPQRPICKVGDLGLSKVKCQTLISGGVRGTLPWMAPELLNGSSNLVSEKVDVFSFGIVMWELLTGEEPYADLHYGAIIGGIVNNTLRPAVPEVCDLQWRSLMEQCWAAEPSERPSFTEIVKRLRTMAASPTKGHPQK